MQLVLLKRLPPHRRPLGDGGREGGREGGRGEGGGGRGEEEGREKGWRTCARRCIWAKTRCAHMRAHSPHRDPKVRAGGSGGEIVGPMGGPIAGLTGKDESHTP